MVEKKCKHCAMMIPKEAKICPHCRKRQGMGLFAKIIIGVFGFLVLAGVIGRLIDSSSVEQKKERASQVLAKRKALQPQTEKVINKLMQTGMIHSIKNANDYYVDVFVTPKFYVLDVDQKKTIVLPIYAYYMTAANKTEDDVFAVRLVDSKRGHEIGKYQMGMLTMN